MAESTLQLIVGDRAMADIFQRSTDYDDVAAIFHRQFQPHPPFSLTIGRFGRESLFLNLAPRFEDRTDMAPKAHLKFDAF